MIIQREKFYGLMVAHLFLGTECTPKLYYCFIYFFSKGKWASATTRMPSLYSCELLF